MTQTTATKRVAPRKTAVKATVKAAKPRTSVTAKAKTPLTVAAGIVQKFYIFVEGARPVSGPRLAAHTNAALSFLGLHDSHTAKKAAVLSVLGVRAVKYHRDIGNFATVADSFTLTPRGHTFFKGRVAEGKVDGNLNDAFLMALRKGKLSEAAGIKAGHLVPVSMAVR